MSALAELAGVRVLVLDAAGSPIASERDALDVIGEAYAHRPDWIALPAARCGAAFFELRTRALGEFAQKLVNYGLCLAIVGEVAERVAASDAFRAFVREANRGRQIWFVADLADLERRLGPG